VLPLATFGSAFVHFVLQFATFVVILSIVRHPVDWDYVWLLPIAILVLSLLLAAAALVLSVLNVHARDTQHLLELALIAMFWINPIVYQYELGAAWFQARGWSPSLMLINPLTSIIITFQRAIYGVASVDGKALLPDADPLWYLRNLLFVGVFAVAVTALALWMFDRAEGNLAEVL
jgi:ABC-2 type transport system permease protein